MHTLKKSHSPYSHAKERKGRLETNLISLSPSPKIAKARCCADDKGKAAAFDKGAPNGLGERNGLLRPEEREEMLDANSPPSGSTKRLSNS